MIVVDSSVWIDHFRNVVSEPVRRLYEYIPAGPLLIGDLILCEVLQGFRSDAEARLVEIQLRRYLIVPLCDGNIAVQAAAHCRSLRSHGITIRKTIAVIIGTFCIERGHSLLHSDRDFEPIERLLGLQVA